MYDEDAEMGAQFRRRRDLEQKSLKCMDFDECDNDPCGIGGTCFNKHGSYTCECYNGFYGENCDDIDECQRQPCIALQHCINNPGSYDCICQNGYQLVSGRCGDIDECADNTAVCSVGEECVNFQGSYNCVAINSDHKAVFRGVVSSMEKSELPAAINTQFRSIRQFLNAQVYNSQNVAQNQYFVEVILYLSVPNTPYIEQRFLDAVDDIFASVNNFEICDYDSECPARSSCIKESQDAISGNCVCYDGFTTACLDDACIMETYTCIDIGKQILINYKILILCLDECFAGIDACDSNANCMNTIGSYSCECRAPFTGNGHYCIAP